ncbi:hypothetical protein EDC04DRAFT_2632102 [Pisolithus marmoratus]|nr:hypothetical protein EDC04DRAFT_2632102 [Pisolithus marmoratus]
MNARKQFCNRPDELSGFDGPVSHRKYLAVVQVSHRMSPKYILSYFPPSPVPMKMLSTGDCNEVMSHCSRSNTPLRLHPSRTNGAGTDTPRSLANIPADVLFEVSRYLDLKADILNFALAASTLLGKDLLFGLLPALYDDVHLDTLEQCGATLAMLNREPNIARHIQKLTIRFPSSSSHSNGFLISHLLRTLAPKLDALHTFIWDAEELPQCDDMWFALRMSYQKAIAPYVFSLGKVFRRIQILVNLQLFQFKNLRGFRLALKPPFYDNHSDSLQELPSESRLWDMLIRRCPNLEDLHISGAPFLPVSVVHPLCYARWPRLRSLSLGDIVLDWQPRGGGVKPPFIAFLEAHPHLQTLRTSHAALSPALLTSLEHGTLPNLKRFAGSLEHLQGLTQIYPQITSVAIDEPLVIRDTAPLLAAGVLQGLRCLTELRVAFVFQTAYEGVNACPRLTKLELVCVRRPPFTVDTLAKIISALPRLCHFRVTMVRARHERSLKECAAFIARSNPQLRTFGITFISPTLPLPIPLSADVSVNGGEPGHPYLESGNYVLHTDEYGLPSSVVGTERRSLRHVPSLRYTTRKYKYRFDLHPKSKKGLGLIFEKSVAGEETRVLLLMLSLGGAALWVFLG